MQISNENELETPQQNKENLAENYPEYNPYQYTTQYINISH